MDQNKAAYYAALDGDLRGVEVALAQGADVNALIQRAGPAADVNGRDTLLVISVEDDHYDVARFLLEHGANPNLADDDDIFPLLTAKTARVIDLLVAHGADVNRQNGDYGETPLMIQVSRANIESLRALLRHGASLSFRNHDDETALTMAQSFHEHARLAPVGAGAVVKRWKEGMEPIINLLQAVEAAGSYKRYLREPVVQLLALRYLSLAGRATAPANLLRLFGAPPIPNAGRSRTRARRVASSAARTLLPDEVFKLILDFWNERV